MICLLKVVDLRPIEHEPFFEKVGEKTREFKNFKMLNFPETLFLLEHLLSYASWH